MRKLFSTLILAAGKGTRMKSPKPKVLHEACGLSLLGHVLEASTAAGAKSHYVVLGHGREEVLLSLQKSGHEFYEVWQKEQKGTGHAAQVALPILAKSVETILVLNGDGPLLRSETLLSFLEQHESSKADLTLGVMRPESVAGYGRVVLGVKNSIKKIVEEKEATQKEKKIPVVNGGIYAVSRRFLEETLPKLKPSEKTGEIYLTDIVAIGAAKKKKLYAYEISPEELSGVNDLLQLAEVERVLSKRKIEEWMRDGVRVHSPDTIFVDVTVRCSSGAVIGPNVSLLGATHIESGAVIEAGVVVKDSVVKAGAVIKAYSYLESSVVREGAHIGPFARLRPGTDIGEEGKIGNFVEVKNSKLGKGSKASHLSYIGDAEVGVDVNIGCGFVACNYDGFNKHKTIIRDRAFVGSSVNAVAPVEIGQDAYVATGSTINRNVPAGALAIAREKQENKEGYAERLRARMQAIKKSKGK